MAKNTRQRMVEAAAELLRTQGLAATSFTDVLAQSGAARGAIYHHFPGGKAQLAREAVLWTGRSVQAHLAGIDAAEPEAVVTAFLTLVRPVVAQAAAGAGCAVAAATVECAPANDELARASDDALKSWVGELDRQLSRVGAGADEASAMSTLMIAFLEGAQVLCRAAGSLDSFDIGAVGVRAAARGLLGLRRPTPTRGASGRSRPA